jgi:hypothetical protein
MTDQAPIVGLADSIVSQDVVDGRPGKTIAPPVAVVPLVDVVGESAPEEPEPTGEFLTPLRETPPLPYLDEDDIDDLIDAGVYAWSRGCCCLALVIALIVLVVGGFVGYRTWDEPSGVALLVVPDFPVSIVPQKPDVSTVPGTAGFNGTSQMTLHYTCGNQSNQFTLPAQLQIGSGHFFLDPQGIPPFDGTVSSANAVNASGQLGTVSGTLATGQTENLTLTTANFPCKGVFPMTLQLPTPLSLGGGTITGPPLASSISGNVAVDSTSSGGGSGMRDVPWDLIIAGVILDLLAIALVRRYPLRDDEVPW